MHVCEHEFSNIPELKLGFCCFDVSVEMYATIFNMNVLFLTS